MPTNKRKANACDLCGKESEDCRPRLMFYPWWVMLFGERTIEREVVCPRCRRVELIKTVIGLGLLIGLFIALVIGTLVVIR